MFFFLWCVCVLSQAVSSAMLGGRDGAVSSSASLSSFSSSVPDMLAIGAMLRVQYRRRRGRLIGNSQQQHRPTAGEFQHSSSSSSRGRRRSRRRFARRSRVWSAGGTVGFAAPTARLGWLAVGRQHGLPQAAPAAARLARSRAAATAAADARRNSSALR